MLKSVTDFVAKSLRSHISERRAKSVHFDKIDADHLTDNMRALRLIATTSDQLVSRGMSASDVVYLALGIAETYCSRSIHVDISNNLLTVSQDRGIDREPLTLVRTIASNSSDYRRIELIEKLVQEIRLGSVTLSEAERSLDKIISLPRLYSRLLSHVATGGVSAGVVMLYSENPVAWLFALLLGATVNYALYRLTKSGLPSFHAQAVAGLAVTVLAALLALPTWDAVPFLSSVDPSLLIIGGLVVLVAGMMTVSAFQDAIDEYYLTAGARLLKVGMMTAGVVFGVTIGLYVATKFGVALSSTPERLSFSPLNYQYIGAAVLAASFALGNQSRLAGVFSAGLVGFMSLYIVLFMANLGLGVIPASGIAAVFVGIASALLMRLFRIPSIIILNSGVIPLVPGITLYSALMHIAQSAPDTSEFNTGVELFMRAVFIAVTIAAGASLGNLVGRLARHRLIHVHNRLPRWRPGPKR